VAGVELACEDRDALPRRAGRWRPRGFYRDLRHLEGRAGDGRVDQPPVSWLGPAPVSWPVLARRRGCRLPRSSGWAPCHPAGACDHPLSRRRQRALAGVRCVAASLRRRRTFGIAVHESARRSQRRMRGCADFCWIRLGLQGRPSSRRRPCIAQQAAPRHLVCSTDR